MTSVFFKMAGVNAEYVMLDHTITVVLNVFDTLKNKGLSVYKFISIQTQEEHIGNIKQSKRDRFQDR